MTKKILGLSNPDIGSSLTVNVITGLPKDPAKVTSGDILADDVGIGTIRPGSSDPFYIVSYL